jgi:hypothetical protein
MQTMRKKETSHKISLWRRGRSFSKQYKLLSPQIAPAFLHIALKSPSRGLYHTMLISIDLSESHESILFRSPERLFSLSFALCSYSQMVLISAIISRQPYLGQKRVRGL